MHTGGEERMDERKRERRSNDEGGVPSAERGATFAGGGVRSEE